LKNLKENNKISLVSLKQKKIINDNQKGITVAYAAQINQ
jgi:hypothetical protein